MNKITKTTNFGTEFIFLGTSIKDMLNELFDNAILVGKDTQNSYKNYVCTEEDSDNIKTKKYVIEEMLSGIPDNLTSSNRVVSGRARIYVFMRVLPKEAWTDEYSLHGRFNNVSRISIHIQACRTIEKNEYLVTGIVSKPLKDRFDACVNEVLSPSTPVFDCNNYVTMPLLAGLNSEYFSYFGIDAKNQVDNNTDFFINAGKRGPVYTPIGGRLWIGHNTKIYIEGDRKRGTIYSPIGEFPISEKGMALAEHRNRNWGDFDNADMRTILSLTGLDIHLRGWKGKSFSRLEKDFDWDDRSIDEIVKLQMMRTAV